jgi:hypothetical protein
MDFNPLILQQKHTLKNKISNNNGLFSSTNIVKDNSNRSKTYVNRPNTYGERLCSLKHYTAISSLSNFLVYRHIIENSPFIEHTYSNFFLISILLGIFS